MNRKAIIFGIKSYKLSSKEKQFFRKVKPWGIILFSRNVKNIYQLKNLVFSIKKIFSDKNYPILIDQEGGEVSRLDKILNLKFFSQEFFGNLYIKDKKKFYLYYKIYVDQVCDILKKTGININTVPVLDVRRNSRHNFLVSRTFSKNHKIVSKLGRICVEFYKKNRIATMVKHIPGHGMSLKDSHFSTPIVNTSKNQLIQRDFKTFKECKSNFAMTAHVVYKKYDQENTATHSKIIIKNVIRNYINFRGILISDDISMKSLKYNLLDNATKSLNAGCNIILHCNGNYKEMVKLSKVIPRIDSFTRKKTSDFYKFLG